MLNSILFFATLLLGSIYVVLLIVEFRNSNSYYYPKKRNVLGKLHSRFSKFLNQNNSNEKQSFLKNLRLFIAFISIVILVFLFFNIFNTKPKEVIIESCPPPINHCDSCTIDSNKIWQAIFQLDKRIAQGQSAIKAIDEKLEKHIENLNTRKGFSGFTWFIIFLLSAIVSWSVWKALRNKSIIPVILSGSLSLLSLTKVLEKIADVEFDAGTGASIIFSQQNINRSVHEGQIASANMSAVELPFGPFYSGTTDMDSFQFQIQSQNLVNTLKKASFDDIIIYGGVDIREPINDSRKKYGNNLILSHARSLFLKQLIRDSLPNIDSNTIISLPGGAHFIREEYDSLQHQQNRMAFIIIRNFRKSVFE